MADTPFDILTWLSVAGERAVTNLKATWDDVTVHKTLRIVVIVCAYLLIRPYLIRATGQNQALQLQQREAKEDEARAKAVAAATGAAVSPNEVRGGIKVAAELPATDEDLAAETSSTDWGTRARKRQRDVLRKIVSAEEKRLEEAEGDEDDKDIEEFLVQ